MSKVIQAIAAVGFIALGIFTGGIAFLPGTALAFTVSSGTFLALGLAVGASLISQLSMGKGPGRAAAAVQLQLGEQPRQAVLGRAAVAGTLVDGFNYGGNYGTDWEVLVIALADHKCDALEGFYVDDTYVAFTGDGVVPGFNGQLEVYWRDGSWDQTVPSILLANGPGWTADDRGRGVAWVTVAYKGDASDAKNPVWPSGRPRFLWVLRGLRCYQARKDSTVGGSGSHRRDNPSTWEWTENPIDTRYNWMRGIYAGDRVNEPGMLLVGRGLSAIEAPPANVFARANLCDELVGGAPRYTIGGVVASTEAFIEVESDFAAAVAGTISQPEGAVEVDPGQGKAAVVTFTDADLLVGSTVTWNEQILGQQDNDWINTVVARFVDPAQKWAKRSAPVRRDTADVIADGGPREASPQLDLVTRGAQAQRVAEITRRLGRLWGRAQVTLPPRFAFIEEGDWVRWQSDRYFGGATLTFRVEGWGSNEAWHHQLTLRQIAASAFSDTAPLDDGSVAINQAPPPAVSAPGSAAWTATGTTVSGASGAVPAIRIDGAIDDAVATRIRVEYRKVGDTAWIIWGEFGRDLTTTIITGLGGGQAYQTAISYLVDGAWSDRRVLASVTTGAAGTPSAARQVVSRSVAYPVTSNDNSITIAAFTAVLSDGSGASFPAGSIGSLASDTNFAVFWNPAGSAYLAAVSPALTQMANAGLIFLGTQRTSSGGTFTPPADPPGGTYPDGTVIP